jgi:predicted  nucleic acid-binding Zn-ribbon protein
MGEKKLVNKTVVVGTTILCVVLLFCFVGAVITYNSMLADKDSVIANKDLQIADKTSQINEIEKIVAESQSEIDDLGSQIAQKNSTITALNQQIGKKERQISDLNSQISQKDSIIENLNNQDDIVADLNKQISQKNSQISSLNSQVVSLNDQISQKDSTITDLTDQISLLESMTSSLAEEISDLNSQILSLNSQIAGLQTQNDDLASEITTLNSEMVFLQLAYDNFVAAYQNLREIINQRSMHSNISDFITPQDPEVISTVYSVTGGWSDTSDLNEFWTDVKALYIWIRTNIEYRSDGLSPVLPFNPSNDLYYSAEMWQFPNETLELEKGDCEDQAILLCSMIRCYSDMDFPAECVWITSSIVSHVGVQIPVSGDELVIFDPAGDYYSSTLFGDIVFNDISVEIDNWLNYWKSQGIGADVYVYRVFSDYLDEAFSSTSEYFSWMYS